MRRRRAKILFLNYNWAVSERGWAVSPPTVGQLPRLPLPTDDAPEIDTYMLNCLFKA